MTQAILMVGLMIPGWYFLVRPSCGAGGMEYAISILSPLVAAFLAMLLSYLAVSGITEPVSRLIGAAVVAVPVYLLLSYVFNRSWLLAMRQLVAFK